MKLSELGDKILIKIDVQGFEKEVIIGGLNIFKIAKIIIIEVSFIELYADEPKFKGIYEILEPLGFSYMGSLKQSVNKKDGSYLQADCIFIK